MTSAAAASRAQALIDVNRPAEATVVLRQALADDPDSYRLRCLLAQSYSLQGMHEACRESAAVAAARHPNGEWAYRLLSVAYEALNQPKAAVDAARVAVSLAPEGWRVHQRMASASAAAGDLATASAAAAHCLRLAPNEPHAHLTYGLIALKVGNGALAKTAFEKTLALQPDNAVAQNNLAKISLDSGRLLDAAGQLSSALANDPQLAVAHYNIDLLGYRLVRWFHWSLVALCFISSGLLPSTNDTLGGSGDVTTGHPRLLSALVPVALIGLAVAVRLVDQRLPKSLRRYFRQSPRRDKWLGGLLVSDLLALAFLASVAFPTSADTRNTLVGAAMSLLVIGVLLLNRGTRRFRRRSRRRGII